MSLRAGYHRATKYVSTPNDDDLYATGYLETMVQALKEKLACCPAFADHNIIDAAGTVNVEASDSNSAGLGQYRLQPGVIADPLELALVRRVSPAC